jgi:hypothetical protein
MTKSVASKAKPKRPPGFHNKRHIALTSDSMPEQSYRAMHIPHRSGIQRSVTGLPACRRTGSPFGAPMDACWQPLAAAPSRSGLMNTALNLTCRRVAVSPAWLWRLLTSWSGKSPHRRRLSRAGSRHVSFIQSRWQTTGRKRTRVGKLRTPRALDMVCAFGSWRRTSARSCSTIPANRT